MKSKRINIFLGGFINLTNAQNLNCLALARHLDKEKFNCFTLELYSGQLQSQKGKIDGLRIFRCLKPARISFYLGLFWGIWKCDVAYLPKGELWIWNRFWLKFLRKKSFSTMEGILDEDNLKSAIDVLGSYANVIQARSFFDKQFSITSYLQKYNDEHHGIETQIKPLYLGCETKEFLNYTQRTGQLSTIVYIGRLKKRKGIYDIVELAKVFTKIEFWVFGDGEEKSNLEKILKDKAISNLKLKGIVSHSELTEILKNTDLHILPSRSEGFPKVTLETAAAGVPSIVYRDYGANEWITHNHNGFVLDTLDQMIETVKQLKENPELLQSNSRNAIEMAKQFDWEVIIKDWEVEIFELVDNE